MKLLNNIHFRVFSNPGEDKDKIKNSLIQLINYSPEEMVDEKIVLKETRAKGFEDKTIIIYEITLDKERHCNKFIKRINELLSKEDKKLLLEQTNRLDDNLTFFLRLDKSDLLDGKYNLTDSGNCFHISMNISAYPRKKEVAYGIVKQIFLL